MKTDTSNRYQIMDNGDYVITDYNSCKAFSSFFPGVAGKSGIPMWTFYVNRGQCLCSMGVEGKHHPIMEFLPANWAYNLTPYQGFRTFVKLLDNHTTPFYEPFQNKLQYKNFDIRQKMIISPAELRLEEENYSLGLKFSVRYFNIPEDSYAGLAREFTIQNLNQVPQRIQVLDGLPLIIPYGLDDWGLKHMRRLFEAFVEVVNIETGVPFYKLKVEPADRPDVVRISKGNFYLGMDEDGLLLPVVYDPEKIFGIRANYDYPESFIEGNFDELVTHQIYENRLPCAMGSFQTTLAHHRTYTYISIIGHADSVGVVQELVPNIIQKGYMYNKANVNREIISVLTQQNLVCSSEPILDHYARQNFLDNVLRGGYPTSIGTEDNQSVVHLYSRKHGDLERDYNDYRLTPTPYSQGNGNFRDVNQNRRSDLFFNPMLKEANLELFYSLIQLDGFNPLIIKETRYHTPESILVPNLLEKYIEPQYHKTIIDLLTTSWTPGELALYLREKVIHVNNNIDYLIGDLISISSKSTLTEHGEGYWIDHWTYNIDLLENYLAIFPEKQEWIIFQHKQFSFYDDVHVVQARDDKYVLWSGKPMQLGAVIIDAEKETLIRTRSQYPNKVRSDCGKGEVYFCTLFEILLSLIINKLASLDPEGIGIEMEADKPGWYDALNGMPGLIGSSLNETLELKRHISYLIKVLADLHSDTYLDVSTELAGFMEEMDKLLKLSISSFEFWESSHNLKESYRKQTKLGLIGSTVSLPISSYVLFLESALVKTEQAIQKAQSYNLEIIPTYFINHITEYQLISLVSQDGSVQPKLNPRGFPCIKPIKFTQAVLPLFLEGPVHYLRCLPKASEAARIVQAIRASSLFDGKLQMYKVNESLDNQAMEIGRARTFSPGWFENESIWLHMEYKYMLEMLRNGLYEDFYRDFRNVFIPFLDPESYGRSILENSSFISSSANPDTSLHGNGFVARLSGATAEFISIIYQIALGRTPFVSRPDGSIRFAPKPAIPAWLFTTKTQTISLFTEQGWQRRELPIHTFSIMFLGSTLITYYNPKLKDTFGTDAAKPTMWKITDKHGNVLELEGQSLPDVYSRRLRDGCYCEILVELS